MRIDDYNLCAALGKRLLNARQMCHLTQEQLSQKAHVSSRHISKIENGQMNPSYEILHSLIRAMNISADTLFFPVQPEDDPLFQKLTAYYQACPEEKRELLLDTVEFVTTKLLSNE